MIYACLCITKDAACSTWYLYVWWNGGVLASFPHGRHQLRFGFRKWLSEIMYDMFFCCCTVRIRCRRVRYCDVNAIRNGWKMCDKFFGFSFFLNFVLFFNLFTYARTYTFRNIWIQIIDNFSPWSRIFIFPFETHV